MTITRALFFTLLSILFSSSARGLNTPSPGCDVANLGSTLKIIPVNNPCSPFRSQPTLSFKETILQMQSSDRARVQYLSNLATGRLIIVPIKFGGSITPNYIVQVNIGTPRQPLLAAFDTSNDVAWFPCDNCDGCTSTTFHTKNSSTLKHLHCNAIHCNQVPNQSCEDRTCEFNFTYASSTIDAYLVKDTITLANETIPGYTFGCVRKTTDKSFPEQGLLGFGRGPLSFLSQTASHYKSTLSYCLPTYKSPNSVGSLMLGPKIQPKGIKTTQLLKSQKRSSLYYVNLLAISVGSTVVNIPPDALAFDPQTGAGTIIDSGTVFTNLVKSAYVAVRDEVRLQMGTNMLSSLGILDTCYNVKFSMPTMTFMFSGGMNMTLPQDNFIIQSSSGGIRCLAMAAVPDGTVNSVVNIIASYQQQNYRVLIDGPNSMLGVSPEPCN